MLDERDVGVPLERSTLLERVVGVGKRSSGTSKAYFRSRDLDPDVAVFTVHCDAVLRHSGAPVHKRLVSDRVDGVNSVKKYAC